jgi:hypothetical protein
MKQRRLGTTDVRTRAQCSGRLLAAEAEETSAAEKLEAICREFVARGA